MVWYSQEARSYALLVALCAAGLWAFAAALELDGGRRALWLWAIAGGLAVATHYFAIFLVGPELCWLVWKRGRRAGLVLAVPVVVGLALAPLAIHQRANGSAGFIAQTALGTRLAQAVKQLALGYDAPAETVFVVLGIVLGCAVLLVFAGRVRRSTRRAALGLIGLGVATVGLPVLLGVVGLDYLITRNLIVAGCRRRLPPPGRSPVGARAGTVVLVGLCAARPGRHAGDRSRQPLSARRLARRRRTSCRAERPSVVVLTPSSGGLAFDYYLPERQDDRAGWGAGVSSVEVIGLGARGVGAPV